MKLEYETTLEDLITTGAKSLSRSTGLKRARQRGLSGSAVAAWIVGYACWNGPAYQRLVLGFTLAALALLVYWYTDKFLTRRKLRTLYLRQLEGRFPLKTIVEANPDNLEYSQAGEKLSKSWDSLDSVRESPSGLDLYFKNGSLIAIPLRAFQDSSRREEFLSLVRANQPG